MRRLLLSRLIQKASQPTASGFTLIEILLVVVLLAILAVAALNAFEGNEDEARLNVTKLEMTELQKALLNFRSDNRELPCQIYKNGNYNPFVDDQYDAMDQLDFTDLPGSPDVNDLQAWCSDSIENAAEDIKQADNGLSMLTQFPYELSTLNSDLLWNASTQRGWNGAYISKNALTDGWGNPYKLLDPELAYGQRYKCLADGTDYDIDPQGFYTCLPPTDSDWNDATYVLPSDIVRIASSGPDEIFDSQTDQYDLLLDDPCVPKGDDLILCLLR